MGQHKVYWLLGRKEFLKRNYRTLELKKTMSLFKPVICILGFVAERICTLFYAKYAGAFCIC
jgi:hypothetical protein